MGIGNPNAEFTPNISVCVVGSDGGTARVLWGFQNGEVAVMTAPRAMDPGRRTSAELVRCDVSEEHEGAVLDALWGDGSSGVMITAGADGRVKVWDAKRVRCVWSSEKRLRGLIPDACVKVTAAMPRGYVVGILKSGEIVFWTGFDLQALAVDYTALVQEVRIPCPAFSQSKDDSNQDVVHDIMSLSSDPHASSPTILVSYQNDPYFYRIRILQNNSIEITLFGDPQFGPISAITPFFSTNSSFVLTGDYIGCVSVYDWHASTPSTIGISNSIYPVKKFEAHEDGASVTALFWNGVTLITGSGHGTTHVRDGLTFEHLRSFASPTPRIRGRGHGIHMDERGREAVSQILVGPEKEVLLVAVGDRVLAWRAGPVRQNGSGGVRGRHSPANGANKKTKERHTAAKYLREYIFIPSLPSWL